MQRTTKIALLITGSVIIAGGLAVGLYFLLRKPKPEDEYTPVSKTGGSSKGQSNSGNADPQEQNTGGSNIPTSLGQITPTFNVENELSNPFSQLKGRVLYPKRETIGGWGYANVRTSAEVNTNQGWWDGKDNLITTINSGIPIGSVISEKAGLFNGYSYRWFKVKLIKPVDGFWSDYTEGYVRADTVTFKPYTP